MAVLRGEVLNDVLHTDTRGLSGVTKNRPRSCPFARTWREPISARASRSAALPRSHSACNVKVVSERAPIECE